MARSGILTVFVLALLVAAAAHAQPSSPAAGVSVSGPDSGDVTAEAARSFFFEVENTSPGTGNAEFDSQNQARVTITADGLPDGWTAQLVPSDFRLPPGGTQNVTMTVTVAAGAETTEAVASVKALLTTPMEGLDPILDPLGGSQTAEATATISLTRDDGVTRGLLETIGVYIWVILFALLAAVVLASKLIADARRVTIALSSSDREGKVRPGSRVALPLTISSLGRGDDTVVFQVSPVGDGWAAFLPVAELELKGHSQEDLHLVVIAPKNAKSGDGQQVVVTANSAQGPRHPASISFSVSVVGAAKKS